MDEKRTVKLPHNLILEGRKKLTLTGVSDVDSFDDRTVVAYTSFGELTIKGKELHISKLNLENGELNLDGEIDSMAYSENHETGGGFLTKLFR